MILKSLKVERFGGLNPGAIVDGFGDAITVIHGPNGAGKSTLFRALTYGLYQRHGLVAQDALSQIVPRGREVNPRVEITFEAQGATWRVTKQFFKKADAELARLERGVFVTQAQGAAAEDALRDLLGSEKNLKGLAGAQFRGIGEILLVDQGDVRFGDAGVSSLARDRLRVVIDQVGTTHGAHEILTAVEKRYAEVFGKDGDLREKSEVSRLDAESARLESARADLLAQIAAAEDLARRLVALQADSPARAQEEMDRLDAELDAARARKTEAALLGARRDALAGEAGRAGQDADRLRGVIAELKTLRAQASRLAKTAADGDARGQQLDGAHVAALEAQRVAEEDLGKTAEHDRSLGDRERAIRDARAAADLARRIPELEERVARFAAMLARVDEAAKAASARVRPSDADMTRIRAAFHAVRDLEGAMRLLEVRVAITAESGASVECGAERFDLGANESREIESAGGLELRIPGVARIGIRPPGGLERARVARDLDQARQALDALVLPFGRPGLEGLEALARERSEVDAALQAARAARDGVFKDEAQAQAAHADLGAARATLAELCERRPEWRGTPPDAAVIARDEEALAKDRQHAGDLANAQTKLVESRRRDVKRAAEDLKAHEKALVTVKNELTGCQARLSGLEADGATDDARDARLAGLEAVKAERARELAAVAADLEVLRDPDATIGRLAAERRQLEADRKLADEQRIRLTRDLEVLRDRGLWAGLADLEIEIAKNREDSARERLAADALKLLRDVLVREQAAAVEAAVRPVAERVSRMARYLFGAAASKASFGESLAPQALVTEGGELPVGLLSAGTQDQLALLTRIALGELYAEKCGRHAFVLDDPLVNCDRGRRGRLLEILLGSRSLQIIVFTCSPELYRGIPDDKVVFLSMDEAKVRMAGGAAASGLTG